MRNELINISAQHKHIKFSYGGLEREETITMQITVAFKGKTLVITGGTGSFGSTVLKHFLTSEIGEIRR